MGEVQWIWPCQQIGQGVKQTAKQRSSDPKQRSNEVGWHALMWLMTSISQHFKMTGQKLPWRQLQVTYHFFGIGTIVVALKCAGKTAWLRKVLKICQDVSQLFRTFFEHLARYVVRSRIFVWIHSGQISSSLGCGQTDYLLRLPLKLIEYCHDIMSMMMFISV